MNQPTSEVTDPNEMRKMIRRLAIYGRMNPDDPPDLRMAYGCSSMVRAILISAEQRGLSDEDTMTMIAYHAIKNYEAYFARLLDNVMNSMQPPLFILDSQKSNATAQKT